MKKSIIYLMVILLLLNLFPCPMKASERDTITVDSISKDEVQTKLARLDEIKKMDKSHMNHSEKKAFRKEAKAINKSLKTSPVSKGTNIYFAVGAVIIILIVLIPLIGQ